MCCTGDSPFLFGLVLPWLHWIVWQFTEAQQAFLFNLVIGYVMMYKCNDILQTILLSGYMYL